MEKSSQVIINSRDHIRITSDAQQIAKVNNEAANMTPHFDEGSAVNYTNNQ